MSEMRDPPAEHTNPPTGFAPCTRTWPHEGPCAHDHDHVALLDNRLRAELTAEQARYQDLLARQAANFAVFDDKIAEVEKKLGAANEENARLRAQLLPHTEQTQCVHVDAIDRSERAHVATTARLERAVAEIQRALDANDIVCTTSCNEVAGHIESCSKERMRVILADAGPMAEPVPMRLPCPGIVERNGMQVPCGELHVDEGEFATKPHHTHACQKCGMVWRPAVMATVGVRFLPGYKNGGDS